MKQKNIPPVKISFQENLLPKLGEGKAENPLTANLGGLTVS